MEQLSFDRAADFYDETRALDPEHLAAIVEVLRSEIGDKQPLLEVGIGTGRIAVPVAQAGIEMVGVDISEPMVRRLIEKGVRIPIAFADARRLPFHDGSLGSALVVHVLHLIPEWRDVCREMVRAVRGGGTVLVDLGGWHDSTWTAVEKHFVSEAGIDKPRVGAVKIDEVDALMAELGAHPRTLEPIPGSRPFTYGALLDRLERGIYSFTWLVDEPTRLRAVAATRVWTAETLGPLDEVREARWEITYHAYDVA